MNKNTNRNHISPLIVLSVVPAFILFVVYVLNMSEINAWFRVLIGGDFFWLFASVMFAIAAVAIVMCFDWWWDWRR